jgi:hypothetical protein
LSTTATAWAEFNNTGTGHWMHGQTYLGTQGPQDRSSPFCTPSVQVAAWQTFEVHTPLWQSEATRQALVAAQALVGSLIGRDGVPESSDLNTSGAVRA